MMNTNEFVNTMMLIMIIFAIIAAVAIIIYSLHDRYNIDSYKNKVMVLNAIGYTKTVKVQVGKVLTEEVSDNNCITSIIHKRVIYFRNNDHPSYPVILDEDVKSMTCSDLVNYIIEEIGSDAKDDTKLMSIYLNILDINSNHELITYTLFKDK